MQLVFLVVLIVGRHSVLIFLVLVLQLLLEPVQINLVVLLFVLPVLQMQKLVVQVVLVFVLLVQLNLIVVHLTVQPVNLLASLNLIA